MTEKFNWRDRKKRARGNRKNLLVAFTIEILSASSLAAEMEERKTRRNAKKNEMKSYL